MSPFRHFWAVFIPDVSGTLTSDTGCSGVYGSSFCSEQWPPRPATWARTSCCSEQPPNRCKALDGTRTFRPSSRLRWALWRRLRSVRSSWYGLARIIHGRIQRGGAPSFLRLLAALFTIQLAIFAGQESVEAALSGAPGNSIDALLLIGTLGQLPVAALAAFALRFLLVEVVPALAEVRLHLTPSQPLGFVPVLTPLPVTETGDVLRSRRATHIVRKRGSPS